MADHAVTATHTAARMATAVVPGLVSGDTISITLPPRFVKTANPLPPDGAAPRYRVTVTWETGTRMEAYSIAWAVAAPEIVLTLAGLGPPAVQAFIIIENVHSIIT